MRTVKATCVYLLEKISKCVIGNRKFYLISRASAEDCLDCSYLKEPPHRKLIFECFLF